MKCVICKEGQTRKGFTTVTVEREHTTVIIKDVPAAVCENCGEYYLNEETTQKIQHLTDQAVRAGVEIEVLIRCLEMQGAASLPCHCESRFIGTRQSHRSPSVFIRGSYSAH